MVLLAHLFQECLALVDQLLNIQCFYIFHPLFGFAAFTAHEVSGISAVQVLFASIAGVWAYRKGGYLNKQLIIYMGGAILIGSLIGSYGSSSIIRRRCQYCLWYFSFNCSYYDVYSEKTSG